MIRFGSVCSGIEAASVATHPLGWSAAWLAEIEAFPSAVLAHHYPDTPNLGDMTALPARVLAGEIEAPDVLIGGTPCQAFSVAGMRGGMADPRGQLTISFVRLADAIDHIRARRGDDAGIVWWENVPGVLSDKENAFGCLLAALVGESDPLVAPGGKWSDAGCVYGPGRAAAWRVLDAQYFGLAQRRRRVFVVASARNGFDPAAVLFERDGVRRDTAPRREAGERTASATAPGAGGDRWPAEVASTLNAAFGDKLGLEDQHAHALSGAPLFVPVAFGCKDSDPARGIGEDVAPTLRSMGHADSHPNAGGQVAVAFVQNQRDEVRTMEVAGALAAEPGAKQQTYLAQAMAVRRLTPRECERLQGFRDDYTRIPWRGKPAEDCPDGPRYKALGNSMAVPVMRWIGARITAALQQAFEVAA